MTEAVFQAPKRRAKVRERFEAPLPVSLRARADEEEHIIFRADLVAHHVTVSDPAHMLPLYQRGFFGKGVFSRSRPEHETSHRWRCAGDRALPVISSSEYQKRLGWARAALLLQGLEDESVSHALHTLTTPVQLDIQSQTSEARSSADQPMDDVSCDSGLTPEPAGPQRQGDPRYDPLAAVCPGDPEQKSMSSERSDAGEYVLVELSEDDHSENLSDAQLECRRNPFSMMEYLQLSYEEAFFLVYALGCLSVYHSGEALSVAQVWTVFRSRQPNFCSSYAAYHYFRSKGWVPKSGVKYGTDFRSAGVLRSAAVYGLTLLETSVPLGGQLNYSGLFDGESECWL
ncbi:tRNA-splicing endonuclease subunit Sen2 [Onychostoma macrolepis]|uniref:tRNA-splicing endonuclease subunit Sen2 n=1 Tax=Onychostoma macrolepis TaxID=369639 RepID=UPI00272D4463|nr:tRNA-splicing endonuclease subunit Sen2 [Onychostoma macrolepis]